ncbi:MAG: ACT domain-containing protein [Actinomycetota bacterium]
MTGLTDLDEMLRTLTVSVRPGRYTFVTVPTGGAPAIGDGVEAVMRETEGDTVVATIERATTEGWTVDFEAAWLTLDVHSALEAVGLTAAFSAALGGAAIPCNVLAAYHHDHLLVPADRADDAVATLEALRNR